jgi:predicted deacetylase
MSRLLVSIHDVTPRHGERLRRIADLLAKYGLGGRYAALVVPNFWREWPLADHPDFVAWLRGQVEEGVEPVLHGYYHRDEQPQRSAWDRLRGRALTAGEGEFLSLPYEVARARIVAGRRLVEDLVGASVTGFVAPAWLYGQATRDALRDLAFAHAEDHWQVWSPSTGRRLVGGPVVAYASRDRLRVAGSLLWSRASGPLLRRLPVLRLAIHPHDLDVPALEKELERRLAGLMQERTPILYSDLVSPALISAADSWAG